MMRCVKCNSPISTAENHTYNGWCEGCWSIRTVYFVGHNKNKRQKGSGQFHTPQPYKQVKQKSE